MLIIVEFRLRAYRYSLHYFFNFSVCLVDGLVTKLCPTLATPWTVARQAPLSMGFSRQEYWSWLPFLSPRSVRLKMFIIKCAEKKDWS